MYLLFVSSPWGWCHWKGRQKWIKKQKTTLKTRKVYIDIGLKKRCSSRDEIGVFKKKLFNWLELDLNLRLSRTNSLSVETSRFLKEGIGLQHYWLRCLPWWPWFFWWVKVIMVLTRRIAAFENKNGHIQSGTTENPPFCKVWIFFICLPFFSHKLLRFSGNKIKWKNLLIIQWERGEH